MLPDGSPGANAEVIVVAPSGEAAYAATADAGGLLHIPSRLDGYITVLRHIAAAGDVRVFRPDDELDIPWQLGPPAEKLVMHAVDATGKPANSALVFLWVGKYRVTGLALAFLARSSSLTSVDGVWVGTNLPAVATRVLFISRPSSGQSVDLRAFDGMAEQVTYPWTSPLTIRAY